MASWRLARSLETLRNQLNAHYPKRSKISDGTIGDARHQKKKSDHNPRDGVVTAFDITEDFKNGPDLVKLLPLLLKDRRTKYAIYEKKLYYPDGTVKANKDHTQHLHLSVLWDRRDEAQDWVITPSGSAKPDLPPPLSKTPAEALKSLGYTVNTPSALTRAVKAFQKSNKLKIDGIIGPMTLRALEKAVQAPISSPVSDTSQPVSVAPVPTVGLEQKVNAPPDLSNPLEALKFYRTLEWSKTQAAALVANLIWESGGNQDEPDTIRFKAKGDIDKNGNHQSFGAGQWNRRAGRFQKLDEFARLQRGSNWQDPETQLAFLHHELITPPYSKLGVMLKASATLEEAMAICIRIWGPSEPHTEKRLAIARKLYDAHS